MVHHQDLVITNDLATLAQVRDLVANAVRKGGFQPQYLNRLQIAVDEAVTNICLLYTSDAADDM
jgi:anti-sigma regulatory factor (Ser/Thr protein kinase)